MLKQQYCHRFIALLVGFASLLATSFAVADPPVRVVRLGYTDGAVSFSPAGENDWVQATVNRPLIGGDRLWADAGARAELQVGTVAMRMGSATSVTLLNLDDRVVQLQLAQGTLDIRVRGFDANHVLEIDTPNLAFSILRAGSYRVDVDPAGNATTVVTRSGQAEVYGENAAYVVDAGAAYRFYGVGLVDYEFLQPPRPDELDRWASERDRRWDTSVSARYVSPEVIGYQDLDANGIWRVEPGYGNVWVPNRLVIGWAPYRDGHWAWIDPWGWTWVDNAPWGFAVSHYGRWANVRNTWCWVPGPVRARAVYAPALVAFVGGRNFQVAISGGNVGAVGWFPLGPRDVYRPAYPVSRAYFNNINTTNTVIKVTNITNVYNSRDTTNVTYANQRVPGAVVAVPTTAFVQAQPVSRAALRLGREQVAAAQVSPIAAVAPTPVSVRGPAAPGHQPPAQALDRQMIAKTAPPAVAVPFASKERLLAENPGKPLDRSAMGTLKPFVPVPAPRVQVVAPAQTAGPAAAPPPAPRGQSEQRAKAGQRGEPAATGTAPAQGVPPTQAVPPLQRGQPPVTAGQQPPANAAAPAPAMPPPLQRGQAPVTAAQPPAGAVAPAPPESRGKSESRAQPPVAISPPPAAAPPPVSPPPESNRRPDQRNAPASTATPPQPAAVPVPPPQPAAVPVPPAQRAQPESRNRPVPAPPPSAATPPPQPAAVPVPSPQGAQTESRNRSMPVPPPSAVTPPPPAAVPVPSPQRAQPESRNRPVPAPPPSAATPPPQPAPVPAPSAQRPPPAPVPAPPAQRAPPEPRSRPEPAQVQRPVAPPAPPVTKAPAAPPPPTRAAPPSPPVVAPPPANVEQRGPGGKPPPPAAQNKKSPEQKKAEDEEKKRN